MLHQVAVVRVVAELCMSGQVQVHWYCESNRHTMLAVFLADRVDLTVFDKLARHGIASRCFMHNTVIQPLCTHQANSWPNNHEEHATWVMGASHNTSAWHYHVHVELESYFGC